ncbi:hypothetical protein EV644_13746 [Kribbella orskensis]|uniref:MMPL family protein n=1 Tax=Kribbella orskensis TaxID=2512216 RepID=A0ABY2B989_9ACTN|nr:hypothetical protein EV642_1391 [Kribbella sp. VKM Ac-2500]TCO10078.1 hypothetical protein EV644_13746 [Kribbella orskensis]
MRAGPVLTLLVVLVILSGLMMAPVILSALMMAPVILSALMMVPVKVTVEATGQCSERRARA